MRENKLDAVDYDAEQSLGQAVGTWEHAALELDGPQHTVLAILKKNDQRWASDAVFKWHEQAIPHAHHGSSIAARRSLRQSARSSTMRYEDFDEEPLVAEDIAASTPTRRHSTILPYRTSTTPSAILPSPYERQLRSEYDQRRVIFADIEEETEEY